jgi:PAS domain S-box-containing protein
MDNFEKAKNPVPVTSYNRHQLREKAMERIAQQGITAADVPDGKDSGWLLRELRVYQVELEMQNEQLMAAQLDMEASHRRYVTYYERAPVAYFTLNLQGVVIQCNEAAIQLLGYERFYLHGHGLLPLVYPEDQARFFAFYDELRMLAGPRNCQVRMRTKGGNLRYVHLEGSRGEADGTTEYLITATDLTGQQQNRDERAARAELLQSAEDIGQTGSYEVDLVTNTFRFSAGMFRLFGEPPHSFTPSQAFIDSRSEPDDAAAVRKIVAQAVAGKQPYGTASGGLLNRRAASYAMPPETPSAC